MHFNKHNSALLGLIGTRRPHKCTDRKRTVSRPKPQSALDIDTEAWGPENWARGTSATIVIGGVGLTPELVWAYKAVSQLLPELGIKRPPRVL